jgi:hypothetical protein
VAFIFAAEFVVGLWILLRAVDVLGDEPESREVINLIWPLVDVTPTGDVILLLLVVGAGLLGSFVQSATSLVSYVGNRTFRSRWTMWYLLRAPIGVALALIIYLVLRGGLLQANIAVAGVVNPYGVAAFAGLAAMFSKQAIDKLGEVFTTMFRTEDGADEERKDSLAGGVVLSSVVPAQLEVGASDREVSLQGNGFTRDMAALVGEEEREVRLVDSTEARLELAANDVAAAGSLTVRVVAGGRVSGVRTVEVVEPAAE